MFSTCTELQAAHHGDPENTSKTNTDEMMETIAHQAMTITAYERVIGKHSIMISEYERTLKELQGKLSDKEKTVQELARINFRQCSALATFRTDKKDREKELQKKEREVEKLSRENRLLKSFHLGLGTKRSGSFEFQEMKRVIDEAKNILLNAIERSKNE